MQIGIIGTGYVGLVTALCFAEMGNFVTCLDSDLSKIERLKKGEPIIHEAGLEGLLNSNLRSKRLKFTSSFDELLKDSQIIFIAVGTPSNPDGSVDLGQVYSVAGALGGNLQRETLIVLKSTVPVGTAEKIEKLINDELRKKESNFEVEVLSNPEFLKQGNAIKDFMSPDRIIIGCKSHRVRDLMKDLYAPFNFNHEKILFMDVKSAELTKYVANSFLATKISFINEISNLCEAAGVDVEDIRKGIGYDKRIGHDFLYAGCGFGGSCFPKDLKGLISIFEEHGLDPIILKSADHRNQIQKDLLFHKIQKRFGKDLSNLKFGLWGLSFKPGTADMREAPSLVLIDQLIRAGAKVVAFDPVANASIRTYVKDKNLNWLIDESLCLVDNEYNVIKEASALVLVTEWKLFRSPDFGRLKAEMKNPIIFDGRNQYEPARLKALGFEYYCIGR